LLHREGVAVRRDLLGVDVVDEELVFEGEGRRADVYEVGEVEEVCGIREVAFLNTRDEEIESD